jgi:hypothetical protein
MTQIEKLEIEPDQTAKVIIDPSGVIVLGNKVRISPVALTHGSVTVRIAESASVSQPNPFTQVVNPLANNPGAPVGLGLALNGVAGQNAAASVVQTAAQTPAALGPAIPAVLLATATPPIIAAELAALPAKASLATIAAALGAAGGGAPAAPVAIPAGTTAVQIIAAMSTLPAAATPIQIASAIGAIVSAPVASTQGAPQQSFLNQAPSIMNAALNSNSPLQQATLVPETNLKIDEQKGKFAILDAGADLEELVNALNLLGTSPREMAQILQSIKAAGALHAEVIVS